MAHIKFDKLKVKNFFSVGNNFLEIDLQESERTLVVGDNGTGKEQPVTEKVLTDDGWVEIGSLKIGDNITNSRGENSKVVDVRPQGVKRIYEVHLSNGEVIRCGLDHLWYVNISDFKNKNSFISTVKSLKSIIKNSKVLSSTKTSTTYRPYKLNSIPLYYGRKGGISVEYSYLIGFLLGNYYKDNDDDYINITIKTKYWKSFNKKILFDIGIDIYNNSSVRLLNTSLYRFDVNYKLLPEYFNIFNLYNRDEILDKNLIEWEKWDYVSRYNFLCGIIDSDGGTNRYVPNLNSPLYNRYSFSDINPKLVILASDLVKSLGGSVVKLNNIKHQFYGTISNFKFNINGFPSYLKENKINNNVLKSNNILKIVETDKYEECVCIQVDAPDNLYVTTGYTLTHNSSCLLDSIVYALFGRAYRNINKNQIINSTNNSNLEVHLSFYINDNHYLVVRGQKPNIFDIYINDEKFENLSSIKDNQKYFETNILGFNYQSFTNVVILGSGNYTPFMQLPLSSRRSLVEEYLDLKIFSNLNIQLKQIFKSKNDKLSNLNVDIKIIQNNITRKDEFIKKLEISYNDKSKSDSLNDKVSNYQLNIVGIKNRINKSEKLIVNLEKEILDKGDIDKIPKIEKDLYKLEELKSSRIKQIEFFNNNTNCPTCKQIITIDFVNSKISKFKNDLIKIDEKINIFKQTLEKLKNDYQLYNKKLKELNNYKSELKTDKNTLQSLSELIKQSEKNTDNDYNLLLDHINTERSELNSYKSNLQIKKVEHSNLTKEINDLKYLSSVLDDNGIKSVIIDKYIGMFNDFVNYYLKKFDLNINFTFTPTFKEEIKSRGRDLFSYESFSEGEKLKISLSIMLSFRLIASFKSSFSCNLLIMDEIFDSSLDSSSDNNLNTILDELRDNNVFVISHRNNLKNDGYDKVLKFVKYRNFTNVECVKI